MVHEIQKRIVKQYLNLFMQPKILLEPALKQQFLVYL